MTASLPASYFDKLYADDPDPWRFAISPYERDKYAMTLNSLPQSHYDAALEVGCSIGVLTRELAQCCGTLVAIDAANAPLQAARERCADQPQVHFDRMTAPDEWPEGRFDLILLSEVVYYLDRATIGRLVDRTEVSLAPRGDILLVHWTGPTNYPLSGDEAADLFIQYAGRFSSQVHRHRTDKFRMDLLRRS